MAQRWIDRDLHFQPDIYRLLLLRLKTTARERVVRILSKTGRIPEALPNQHASVGVDDEVHRLVQFHDRSVQFIDHLAQRNTFRGTCNRETIKLQIVQQAMNAHPARSGINLIRISVCRRNVGQRIRHLQIQMGRRGHPVLGDILDGITRGDVACGDLQLVFRLLYQYEVVAGAAVGRVNFQRLAQLGLRLVVAAHFVKKFSVLHESGGLQFLVDHALYSVDRFLGGHPPAQLGQAGIDLSELFARGDVVRSNHQDAVHFLACLGQLAAGGVLLGQRHAHASQTLQRGGALNVYPLGAEPH
ncbi:MAG TPA: hypothetical protein DGJ56_08165 [Verrucomicrobiales bacterium]|nr:hypothetical protein [Verrucomicrobiales bacterium]